MSSVDEVFRQMQTFAEGEETIDSNNYCMLESDTTRKILIPEKYSIFGVESDEKSNRIKFKFPQHVNDIDLSELSLRINYRNANGEIDQNLTENKEITDDRFVTFEWVLTRKVTAYMGDVDFIVCAIKTQPDGTLTNEWNTTIATVQTLEGLEPEPVTEEETEQARDLLTQLLSIMLSVKTDSVQAVNDTKDNAITEITQTKTQAISDVQAEGQTQTEAVDAKGAQVLESIPDDYTTLENRVDELEQNRAYVIVGNGSGEFVTLSDSSELKTRNVKLFGKSVQAETTGAQLFDINTAKNYDEAEITDYSSGTMEIEQNNSAMTQSPKLKEWCPTMQAGQSYLLTCETTSTKKYITIGSSQWDFGGIFIPSADDLEENVEWHCTTQRSTSDDIVYYRDTFAGIMIVEGSTEKPYEVYTGGEAATKPTPDHPLPITSAGNYNAESEKYEIGILVANKNFASNVDVYSGYYTDLDGLKSPPNSSFICVSKIKIIPGVKYRISSNLKFYSIWSYDVNDNPIRRISYDSSNTISLNATDKEVYIGISLFNTSGQADTTAFEFIQIEVGEEQTSYIDGKSQNTTLQISNPFRGIPVNSGGNYTDSDGQQWLCDYIDRERGKYVQVLQSLNFVGSPNFAKSSSPAGDFAWYGAFDKASKNSGYRSMSSFAEYSNSKKAGCFAVTGTALFYTPKEEMTVAEINELFQSMIDSRSVYIISQLPEPIETSLTQEQLSALNLSTYQGITNIGTDTMPQVGIDVEYIADTKTYIDNAIAEAIAAIPTEQGGNKL